MNKKSIWQFEWVCHTCHKVGKSVKDRKTAQKRADQHELNFGSEHRTEVKMFGSMYIKL
jgi:hypothetical protein